MNEINIDLTKQEVYEECIKNLLLYSYKDYITLYDRQNEIIIKKTSIIAINVKYSLEENVLNRYIKSVVNILCDNNSIIKVSILSSPQDPISSKKGYITKSVLPSAYTLDMNILTYTNGNNNTLNTYYDSNNNVYKIEGLNLTTYYANLSLYDALTSIGINYKYSDRNDYSSLFLIDGKYVGSITGSIVNNQSLANIDGCVFQFECDLGFELNSSSNIISWMDQINKVKLVSYDTGIFNNDLHTANSLRPIVSNNGPKQLLANNLLFDKYGFDTKNNSISICWITRGQTGGFSGPSPDEQIIIGDGINDVRLGFMNKLGNRLYYSDGPLKNYLNGDATNLYAISSTYIFYNNLHSITIERTSSSTGRLKYYLNTVLMNTLENIPYKINNGSLLLRCSKPFYSGYLFYYYAFYMFNRAISSAEVTNLFNYCQSVFGHLTYDLNPEYSGIYHLEADYGVTKNGDQVVSWQPKCNRMMTYGSSAITQTSLYTTPTGIQSIVLPGFVEMSNQDPSIRGTSSSNPAYSLYPVKGDSNTATIFVVSKNLKLQTFCIFRDCKRSDATYFINTGNSWTVNAQIIYMDNGVRKCNIFTNNRANATGVYDVPFEVIRFNYISLTNLEFTNGELAAIIVFDYVLSNAELDSMFSYLNNKYIGV
jgi:hypothetical protein